MTFLPDDQSSAFVRSLGDVINRFSRENKSDTPDFLLAEFLVGCLQAFEHSVVKREKLTDKSLKPAALVSQGDPPLPWVFRVEPRKDAEREPEPTGTAPPEQASGEESSDPHVAAPLTLCPCCAGTGFLQPHGYPRTCDHCRGFGRVRTTTPAVGIAARSGKVMHSDPLVAFLYVLMRDGDVCPGRIEEVLKNNVHYGAAEYSNGWLAQYASDIANRLRKVPDAQA